MSKIIAKNIQIGNSNTASQNFTLAVPSTPDGTIKLARGNAGATTSDILEVDGSDNIGIKKLLTFGTNSSFNGYKDIPSAIKFSSNTANNPYIDFHTSNTWQNYNVRISAEGSAAGIGDGDLYVECNTLVARGSTSATGSGFRIDTRGANSSTFGRGYIDFRNESSVKLSSISSDMFENGASDLAFYTTIAGSRTSDRRKRVVLMQSDNNVFFGDGTWSTYGVAIVSGGNTSPVGGSFIHIGHSSGTANGTLFSSFRYNDVTIGSISQATTSSVAYNTTSDERLKENIVDAPDALPSIMQMQIRSFDWKNETIHEDFGMIAQELKPIAPTVVYSPEDEDQYMGVDYSKLVPRLIKAIQELKQEFDAYKASHP